MFGFFGGAPKKASLKNRNPSVQAPGTVPQESEPAAHVGIAKKMSKELEHPGLTCRHPPVSSFKEVLKLFVVRRKATYNMFLLMFASPKHSQFQKEGPIWNTSYFAMPGKTINGVVSESIFFLLLSSCLVSVLLRFLSQVLASTSKNWETHFRVPKWQKMLRGHSSLKNQNRLAFIKKATPCKPAK